MKSVNQIFLVSRTLDWTSNGGGVDARLVGRIFLFITIFISKLCSDLELVRFQEIINQLKRHL